MKQSVRTTKGQFKNGTSGNPSGRPAGSRNKTTLACEQLLEGKSEQLTSKLMEEALKGNVYAMRMCMDRILPARKERCISLEVRPVTNLQDLTLQFQDIFAAIGEGQISPAEGESLSNISTSFGQTIERANLAQRIVALESHIEDVQACRREIEQFKQSGEIHRMAESRKE